MDWKDVGKLIAPLAPMAGSILGGLIPFPGGSIIGQKFGELIAGAFGVAPTPDAVAAAVKGNPNEVVLAKLHQATELARIQITGFTDIERAYLHAVEVGLTQTGETMRAELLHEHLFFTGWRPTAGWEFDFFAAVYGVMITVAASLAAFWDKTRPLEILTNAWPLLVGHLGALGLMVGVYIIGRSTEKGKAIETGAPMPNVTPKPAPPSTDTGVRPAPPSPSAKPPVPAPKPTPRLGRDD